MKKTWIVLCLLVVSNAAMAQEEKLGHTIQLGGGMFWETNQSAQPGATVRMAYELNIPVGGAWWLDPSIGVRGQRSDLGAWLKGQIGGEAHAMVIAELYCAVKYQIPLGNRYLLMGIAPGIDYKISRQKYLFSAEPLPTDALSKISGKQIFNNFDVGLRPSVLLRIDGHWGVGLEATIGVLQAKVQYAEYPVGETCLNSVLLVGTYRF